MLTVVTRKMVHPVPCSRFCYVWFDNFCGFMSVNLYCSFIYCTILVATSNDGFLNFKKIITQIITGFEFVCEFVTAVANKRFDRF